MKLNTKMPVKLKPYFQRELNEYLLAFEKNKMEVSWKHLERAHILGQPYPIEHTYVHWKMLLFGIKTPRLLVGGVKSFVGKIPTGNTGGANVPPLLPMQIPDDIALIINSNN